MIYDDVVYVDGTARARNVGGAAVKNVVYLFKVHLVLMKGGIQQYNNTKQIISISL